jgi:S-DNA-T family DNA segregation ATPase FtsK/SpoIIIE
LIVFGLISLLGLFNLSGHFGSFVSKWLTLIFGFGRFLVPFLFLYWALMLIRQAKRPLRFTDYLGLILFFISYQTLFHFFYDNEIWRSIIETGVGGGYVGYNLSRLFYYLFGFWGGVLVLIALFLVSLVLMFNTSLSKNNWRRKFFCQIFSSFQNLFSESFFSRL